MLNSVRRILEIENLDILISFSILISAILMYLLFSSLRKSEIYSPIIIILILIPVIYLLLRDKFNQINLIIKSKPVNSNILYMINILFINLFTFSIILLYFADYTRPISYFIIITLIVALLTFEILIVPQKNKLTNLLLLKIILIGLNLRLGIQILYPDSFLWYDPWYHAKIVNQILYIGLVPKSSPYSSIAGMHVFIATERLFTSVNNILINYIDIFVKTVITTLLIYLICVNLLKNNKIGLLSALMYTILDRTIIYDVSFSPTAFTTIFALFIIYLVFKQDFELKMNNTLIILIFMTILILSHTLTPTMLFFVLLTLLVSSFMIEKIYKKNKLAIIGIILLLSISTLSYWMYVTGYYFDQLLNIFSWSFNVEKISPYMSFETTSNYLSKIPLIEHFLSYMGIYIVAFFSMLGFLYSILKKDKYVMLLSIAGLSMLFFSLIGILFKVYTLPDRWWYYSFHLLSIIATIGIVVLFKGLSKIKGLRNKKNIQILLIVFMFAFISFFSITSPVSNLDSPIFSPNITVRHISLTSEIDSANTLDSIYNQGNILTDVQYSVSYNYLQAYETTNNTKIEIITEKTFSNKTYNDFKGLIIIRKYILDGNPFDARGIYKLTENQSYEFQSNKFNKIYDSNTILGYLR